MRDKQGSEATSKTNSFENAVGQDLEGKGKRWKAFFHAQAKCTALHVVFGAQSTARGAGRCRNTQESPLAGSVFLFSVLHPAGKRSCFAPTQTIFLCGPVVDG